MNKIISFFFYFSLTLMISSCEKKSNKSHGKENKKEKHWSYEGETSPKHWAEFEKNSDCAGKNQSPINIIENTTIPISNTDDLKILYDSKTILSKVENNGHSIQFDFKPGDSIYYKEDIYHLNQIHFHEPAEHTINGIRYPIEIHFVHKSKKGNLTVLGIFGREGEISQLFEFFESFLPIKNGESKDINKSVDLTSLYKENKNFYSYSGSLTTPPCTENVNWVIFKNQIQLSHNELIKIRNNMPINNYRNEQPLNNRKVYLNYQNN